MKVIDINNRPSGDLGGSVWTWERGRDPWHADAFPKEFQSDLWNTGERKEGWFGLDYWGNRVAFIADGTIEEV